MGIVLSHSLKEKGFFAMRFELENVPTSEGEKKVDWVEGSEPRLGGEGTHHNDRGVDRKTLSPRLSLVCDALTSRRPSLIFRCTGTGTGGGNDIGNDTASRFTSKLQ